MSIIKPAVFTQLCLRNRAIFYSAVRNFASGNEYYKPRPFPKTPEERAAAAEKYQLELDDYKPYPDDGSGLGDYPDLPPKSIDSKDPFYPYDCPELRRNFQEPLHAEEDMWLRYDINARHRVPGWLQFTQTASTFIVLFGIYYAAEHCKFFHSLAEKQYPGTGEKHYTFEPLE